MTELANDLDQFSSGLMAACRANVALDVSDDSQCLLTKKHIRAISLSAVSGEPPFERQRLDAAFEFFRKTRSMAVAIEGLSFRPHAQARLRRLTRRTTLYLILIVAAAIASLAFFWFQLRPRLDLVYADIVATSKADVASHSDGLMMLACVVPLLLVMAALLWQLLGRTNWFARFSGADDYMNLGQQAIFWATTQRLVEAGQTVAASTTLAGKLLRIDPQPTLPGGAPCESLEQIISARSLMEMLARQKIESVSTAFPTAAVVTVGGACTLICALATFYPVVRLLNELSIAGVR
jgi:hypothetical protein